MMKTVTKGNKRIAAAVLFAALVLLSMAPTGMAPAATADIEVGFSPDGTAEALVLRVIKGARQSVRLAGYAFTAPAVVRALIAAQRRGVDVQVVVDDKGNDNKASVAALSLLVNAGIPTRLVSSFPIQHSKYIVIDGQHVQTGSYNYTVAAARYNSENVLVMWNCPDLARIYLDNWQRLFDAGQPVTSSY
jgi:phosphatidylserine/phosphatidylglycerophosphate/cardiolipin synthase-like enzyme